MPDRLEDVEGFFGLEEIENIDVVKNAENGTVEYRVRRRLQSVYSPIDLV